MPLIRVIRSLKIFVYFTCPFAAFGRIKIHAYTLVLPTSCQQCKASSGLVVHVRVAIEKIGTSKIGLCIYFETCSRLSSKHSDEHL